MANISPCLPWTGPRSPTTGRGSRGRHPAAVEKRIVPIKSGNRVSSYDSSPVPYPVDGDVAIGKVHQLALLFRVKPFFSPPRLSFLALRPLVPLALSSSCISRSRRWFARALAAGSLVIRMAEGLNPSGNYLRAVGEEVKKVPYLPSHHSQAL